MRATLCHVEAGPRADHFSRAYLAERGLAITQMPWLTATPLIGSPEVVSGNVGGSGISSARLWMVMRPFFPLATKAIETDHAPLAEELRRASPGWMRHTHATHALGRDAELATVCEDLLHA